jgi:hypothetical protein
VADVYPATPTVPDLPDTEARVTAWIRERCEAGWFNTNERLNLRSMWADAAQRHGAESPAAIGVLRALIREAWSCPNAHAFYSESMDEWCFELPRRNGSRWWDRTEIAAHLRALEAAP